MPRILVLLAVILGVLPLVAPAASVGVATSIDNRASGSAAATNNVVGDEARLNEDSIKENIALGYVVASDDAVAAKSAGQLGREGEALASQITGAGKNTESWIVNGRTRIPDQVLAQDIATRNPTIITEVKNARYQSLTRQLRDYADLVGPGGRVDVADDSAGDVTPES